MFLKLFFELLSSVNGENSYKTALCIVWRGKLTTISWMLRQDYSVIPGRSHYINFVISKVTRLPFLKGQTKCSSNCNLKVCATPYIHHENASLLYWKKDKQQTTIISTVCWLNHICSVQPVKAWYFNLLCIFNTDINCVKAKYKNKTAETNSKFVNKFLCKASRFIRAFIKSSRL